MYRIILPLAALAALAACSPAQQEKANKLASTPAGQLFCAIQTSSGPVVAAIVGEKLNAMSPTNGPQAAIATGAAKSVVDATCAAAGGVPAVPPANPAAAPQIAVQLPQGQPTAPVKPAS
jgi:hypothetical protein